MIKMVNGNCEGCGRIQLVKINIYDEDTEDDQRRRANEIATAKCGCEEPIKLAAWNRTRGTIDRVCGSACEEIGFLRIAGKAQAGLTEVARLVFDGVIDKAQIETAESVITVKPKGDGVTITRKSTLEIGD